MPGSKLEVTVRPPSPVRTCLGCRKPDRKDAMVRIVAHAGDVRPDFEGRKPGRGGYLHPQHGCLEQFTRAKVKEFPSLRLRVDRVQRSLIVDAIRERLDRKPALE